MRTKMTELFKSQRTENNSIHMIRITNVSSPAGACIKMHIYHNHVGSSYPCMSMEG